MHGYRTRASVRGFRSYGIPSYLASALFDPALLARQKKRDAGDYFGEALRLAREVDSNDLNQKIESALNLPSAKGSTRLNATEPVARFLPE
jgi:hypothetical protein